MSGFEIELPSSPDPLGDEVPSDTAPVPPSTTRRLLQSTASSRFSARPGTSPRKRMFALDVGNEITPQTIYVTVEAGQDGHAVTKAPAVGSSVRRRLFGSPTPQPSPQRRVRTTTTTVPLRGLTDDEGGPTPRHRRRSSTGRPGTPAAASAKKKKRGTPTPKAAKKSPKKPRRSRGLSSDVDVLQADTPAVTPRRRGRPPKRKIPEDLAEQDDPSATQTLPRKKGGNRREALGPDDMDGPLNEGVAEPEPQPQDMIFPGNNNLPEEPISDTALEDGWNAVQAKENGDLWMDNMSDPPAANGRQEIQADDGSRIPEPADVPHSDHAALELDDQGAQQGDFDDYAPTMDNDDESSDVGSRRSEPVPDVERHPDELEDQGPLPGESDDYAPIMEQDDRSDTDSQRSEQLSEFRDPAAFRDELDHTVDPESFTMIGLESMQSFRASRNVATSDPAEIGEGTSLFINKTLDSLRQQIAESDEDEVDVLVSRDRTPAEGESEIQAPTDLSARIRLRISPSPAKGATRQVSRISRRAESVAGSISQHGRHEYARSPAKTVKSPGANGTRSQRNELTDDDDSFSDIPEEVLAAAESDEQLLGPTQQEVAWTVSFENGSNHSDASPDDQNHGQLQDSHATPSHSSQSQRSVSRSAQSRRPNQAMERDSPPQSLRSRTDSNRLLTPDATTSSSTQSPPAQQNSIDQDEGPMAPEDVGSSPPEITSFIEQNDRTALPSRRNSDTPANAGPEIHVDRVQERQTFAAVLQPALLGGPRPTLSPVVRIGRTLQNILSDPPSPSGASSVLGSPFKGSVRNSSPLDGAAGDEASQSGTASVDTQQTHLAEPVTQIAEAPVQSPGKLWAMSLAPLSQIKNLVTQGALLFTSPHVNVSQDMEDPFAPSSPTLDKSLDDTRNSAFMDRIRQASREESRPGSRFGRGNITKMHHPPSSHSVASETPQHSQRRNDAAAVGYDGTHGEDANEVTTHQPQDGIDRPQVDEHSSDSTIPQESNNGDGSAGKDGMETEEHQRICANNLTSAMQHQEPGYTESSTEEDDMELDGHQRFVENPSTSAMQRQEPTHFAESVEEGHIEMDEDSMQTDDAPAHDTPADDEEDEDIWAIEADRTASSPQFAASQHDTSTLFRKSELSVDWGTRSTNYQGTAHPARSPAFNSRRSIQELPPEDLEDYSLVDLHSGASGTSAEPSATTPTPEHQKQSKKVDLSDLFSSSPNFIERQRRAKEASLAKLAAQAATEKPAQVAYPELSSQATNDGLPSLKSLPTATLLATEAQSSDRGASQDPRRSSARTSSSATPEQARHRVQAPRMTPRRAQNDAALFESWSVSSRAPTERPPTSEASSTPRAVTPLVRDSSSFESPELRALPGRAASPSKSCLRSPLKPRTPGRLVEFTSSTMSETAPLQALANSQKNASVASTSNALLPGPSFPGKENQTAVHNNTFTHASPQHKRLHSTQQQQRQQTVDSPLSQTRWSRDHWLYLDDLWKEYQHHPREFQRWHSSALMATPSKRRSSSLLGKVVSNQGESVELHQMHLDVVDTFKKEVGGWDEESLAKRLFALIVGAERRRLGLVPKRR